MLLCPHSTARGIEVRTSHLLEAREAVRCWSQWSAALIHYTHCLTVPNAQPQPDAENQGTDTGALEKWLAAPNFLSQCLGSVEDASQAKSLPQGRPLRLGGPCQASPSFQGQVKMNRRQESLFH